MDKEENEEELQFTTQQLPKATTIVIPKKQEYWCPILNTHGPFSSEAALKKHIKEAHPKEAERWFKLLQLAENMSKEELIADFKSYDPKKLMETEGGKRILADDHRIVHTWWNRLKAGKAMKSKQFRNYNLEQQKKIVRHLHDRIVAVFDTLKWKHRTPLAEETLIDTPGSVNVEDLEEVDAKYVEGLADKEVRTLYFRLHWIYHNVLKRITEPLDNAHIFVVRELKKRNIRYTPVGDALDKRAKIPVFEYPKVEASVKENKPIIPENNKGSNLPLDEALEAFPDLIVLGEDPIHVHLVGRIVNKKESPAGHDVDILFKQSYPDARVVHAFVDAISETNPDLARRFHFVWDPEGPQVGYSVPLYRLAFKRITEEEMQRVHPKEYLSKFSVGKPIRPLKPKSGFHKHEFFDPKEMWDKWGAKVIEKGLIIQKKYDGMRFQIHLEGDSVKIITEDKRRDRASVFSKSVKELISKKKVKNCILDAEMVEYDCKGKVVKDMEKFCSQLKREKMIQWITATKKALDDENIVFHIHDCVFIDGEDIHMKGYEERWNAINRCFPKGLKHWRRVEGTRAKDVRSFFAAVKKERSRPGSEGVVAKTKDSVYKTTGRTGDWAKLKNLKEIDVMVWDVVAKKTKAGKELDQWIYYPVFKIPCGMKDKIKENQVVEYKGKCYAKIGRAYGTKEKAKRGDIITIRPVQIVENKTPAGKIYWSWMFPYFEAKKPEKHEPDTIDTVRKITKAGTAPLSEELTQVIRLPECPYWNDTGLCMLRSRFYIPEEESKLSKEGKLEEYLKFPIVCKFANRFKCHFVKDYYYDLRPREEYEEKDVEYYKEDE